MVIVQNRNYHKLLKLLPSLRLAYYDTKCQLLKLRRRLKNYFTSSTNNKFLFILCPPYCGSTLMHEILCTSPFVSPNNIFGTSEGQSLPEFRKIVDHHGRWKESYQYPWEKIKNIWMKYWDHSKPLLLEKSPPNLIRAKMIVKYFSPVSFIVMVRDRYVHCEGLMRRNKLTSREAAEWSLQCFLHQKKNLMELNNIILIRYEDLVEKPEYIKQQLIDFLPSLQNLDLNKKFKSHYKNNLFKITNMNSGKIERIASKDMKVINDILMPYEDLLHYFNYSLYHGH